ncbi:MAG: acyl--CoA ligase [gamma proteobacterium endosymbiont of Lamellibrachia anaximandri]|nr:acyl--CoA ligase [gamma proteobacterium endosymbiont of Lamellibrachia anaximandri]MBL3533423.1 acyl--CoA ligase [gamma proteobacterium endosymbiont of Lamellibrachia anaximandri]
MKFKPSSAPELSVLPGQWLSEAAIGFPEFPAILLDGEITSYVSLERQVDVVCTHLAQAGVSGVVAICIESRWMSLLLFHAALKMGFALLPIDPSIPAERYSPLIRQSGCRFAVVDSGMADFITEVDYIPASSLLEQTVLSHQSGVEPNSVQDGSTVLLVITTSGTTGEPKGVMLTGANLAASATVATRYLDLKSGDRWLNCLPMIHIAGQIIALRCLRVGAAMLLHQGFKAARVWEAICYQSVSHISLVPAMLASLLDVSQGPPPASLSVVLIGGGPLSTVLAERAHRLGWPIVISYGMSESGSLCVADNTVRAGLDAGVVGVPMEGFEVALSQTPAGRIRLRGAAVMAGYVNPQLNPGDGLQQDWFETGDIGEFDETGQLRVVGRADDVLVSGGSNIHPAQVESMLLKCQGLEQVGVTGKDDPLWGYRVVAYYVGTISAETLETWARTNLPGKLRPREFHQVKTLPLTRLGKLDRKALKSGS